MCLPGVTQAGTGVAAFYNTAVSVLVARSWRESVLGSTGVSQGHSSEPISGSIIRSKNPLVFTGGSVHK
jgi:hypothetical protein